MVNKVQTYHIIDEPRVQPWEYLIVQPLIILLVAMFLPIFWHPPLFGNIWIPMLWAIFNGFLLGSPTLKKELLIIIVGLLLYIGIVFGSYQISDMPGLFQDPAKIWPYVRIILQALFIFTVYMVVALQMAPYELFMHFKEHRS